MHSEARFLPLVGMTNKTAIDACEMPKGVAMRISFFMLMLGLLLMAGGCTTTASSEKPKIHCPACGTDLDALMHKHF